MERLVRDVPWRALTHYYLNKTKNDGHGRIENIRRTATESPLKVPKERLICG